MKRSRLAAADVRRLAGLARLEVDAGECVRLAGELGRVLDAIDDALAEDGPGTASPDIPPAGPVTSPSSWRDDTPRRFAGRGRILAAVPRRSERFVVVPRVIDR